MILDGWTDGRIDSGCLEVVAKSADRMPVFTLQCRRSWYRHSESRGER